MITAAIEANKYKLGAYQFTPDCMEIKEKTDKIKVFGANDYKQIAETRKLSKTKEMRTKIKNSFKGLFNTKGDDEHARYE